VRAAGTVGGGRARGAVMKVLGWTLLIASILLHFSVCEWRERGSSSSRIIGFVHAREQFRVRTGPSPFSYTYNVLGAGFWGLVIPALLAGGGVFLIVKGPNTSPTSNASAAHAQGQVKPPQASHPPQPPPPPSSNPKLAPCPDCGRHVSRLAQSCPQCGRPLSQEKPE